ncbi:hypothetical protein QAD02_018670 [Eretmocerus hayati]|uniref:Uncharacterized protein n=1 Tax=Eretmocerus hayati TaxID=131215 RepID=A0ACC2PIG6_9HYME|nr:hypothetical protein QAD02_018670 [Eretmocerus hayati]
MMLKKAVDKMKSIMLDDSTSLYQILLKDSFDTVKYANNEKFIAVLRSRNASLEMAMFQGMLIRQFQKGLIRIWVLKPAKEAMRIISRIDLPPSCIEHILKYLDNGHLKNLIRSVPIEKTRKRLLASLMKIEKSQPKFSRLDECPEVWMHGVEFMATLIVLGSEM